MVDRQPDRRQVLNAILYVVRTGCQWRQLPCNFPKWSTVYGFFWNLRNEGPWQKIHDRLREKVRMQTGKKSTPTVAIVDSQSIRTSEGGAERGYDAGKKITGRKRHLAVDTLGLILTVVIHSATLQDQAGAKSVLKKLNEQFCRLKVIFGDSAYGRQRTSRLDQGKLRLDFANGTSSSWNQRFLVLPKRWIVERTFAWLVRYRGHCKDNEKTVESAVALTYIAMIALMSKRLAKQ